MTQLIPGMRLRFRPEEDDDRKFLIKVINGRAWLAATNHSVRESPNVPPGCWGDSEKIILDMLKFGTFIAEITTIDFDHTLIEEAQL